MEKLGVVHTVSSLVPTFSELAGELLPGIATTVIVDELLLKRTIRDGALDDVTRDRLQNHIAALTDFGVEAVIVTCSSVGALVDEIAAGVDVPVVRVDRAMVERAVSLGSTIGVLATLPTTLAPTAELIKTTAREAGRTVEVVPRLCAGAFAALEIGDRSRHDAIIAAELERLVAEVDVVVLAQASMARIAERLGAGSTPVLSSPRLAMEALTTRSLKDERRSRE
jgi:Asp/Glu/hydantoin racemase